MKIKKGNAKIVLVIASILLVASFVPLLCFNVGLVAETGDDGLSGLVYGTDGYQVDVKEEIREDVSKDGITFIILGDGTVRITEFPEGYSGWDPKTATTSITELEIPGTVTTADGTTYVVSELSNTVGVIQTVTYGNYSVKSDLSGKLTGCTKLILPRSLEKIWDETSQYDYDMNNQSNLSILSLPNLKTLEFSGEGDIKLSYIGAGAFAGVESFPIDIPASVKYIGAAAFKSLKTVGFEAGSQLEYVGDGAFLGLSAEQTITLPNSFEYLGSAMPFGLATVTYPESFVTSDGVVYDSSSRVAYSYSGSTETVTIKDGTEMIASKAFYNSSVKVINLPSSVKTIGDYAFADCLNLESVVYDQSVSKLESIGVGAFSIGWETREVEAKLGQIGSMSAVFQFPATLKVIGENAFSQLGNSGNWSAAKEGNGVAKELVFPENNQLVTIGNNAFANFYALNRITFGSSSSDVDGVVLGNGAFLIVEGVSASPLSVSFGSSFKLKEIGDDCFSVYNYSTAQTDSGKDLDVPRVLQQFGSENKQVTIGPTVEKIGKHAFFGCVGDDTGGWAVVVENESRLNSIGSAAFYGFKGLSRIDLSKATELESLSTNVFNAGTKGNVLIELKLPQNLVEILGSAFENQSYSGENKIALPSTTYTLEARAFSGMSASSFSFGSPLMKITTNAFEDATANEVIGTGAKITSGAQVLNLSNLGNTFKKNNYQENNKFVFIDSSGVQINQEGTITKAILCYKDGNGKLTVIRVMTEIEGVVVIPDNTEKVMGGAFKGCKSVTAVVIEGTNTAVEDATFPNVSKGTLSAILTNSNQINTTAVTTTAYSVSLSSLCGEKNTTSIATKGAYWMGQSYYVAGERAVFFISDIVGKELLVQDVKYENGVLTFKLSCSDWYSASDLVFKNGDNILEVTCNNGTYSYTTADKYVWIQIAEAEGGVDRTVTFHGNGGYFDGNAASTEHAVIVKDGKTVHESQYVVPYRNIMEVSGWYTDSDCTTSFDLINGAITSDIDLYAKWKEAAPVVTFANTIGTISASSDAGAINSGDRVSGEIRAELSVPEGYAFYAWVVSEYGKDPVEYTGEILSVTLQNDASIDVKVHSYSGPNIQSVTSADMPTASMIRSWILGGHINTSMNVWTGLASTPIVVDDRVYVRIASLLYEIEADTGYIVKTVESKTVTDYYHYVGFGDEQILDYATKKVYDLDLNYLYSMPVNMTSATYYDGFFYGPATDGSVYRFSSNVSSAQAVVDSAWSVGYDWFGMYGQSSAPVFYDGYIYYINAVGDERYIVSASLGDATAQRVHLGSISKHMLDDGWLTYYDGKLYLTSYTVGLFGTKSTSGNAMITSMSIDGGKFSDVVYTEVVLSNGTPIRSILSKFVIVDGIGYLNASGEPGKESYLIAFNVEDMTICGQVASMRSHGSIVVNQYNGNTTVYLLPYESKSLLKAWTYDTKALKFTAIKDNVLYKDTTEMNTYNSQAVRADTEGRLYWYNDDGAVRCYTTAAKNTYFFFIEDNGVAQWYQSYGATAADALKNLGSSTITLTAANGLATVYGKDASGWSIFYLKNDVFGYQDPNTNPNGWKEIDSLYDSSLDVYHYYAITSGNSMPDSTEYSYIDGSDVGKYVFADNVGDRSIVGTKLIAGSEVYTIRFFDNGNEIEGSALIGAKDAAVEGAFPMLSKSGYVAFWYIEGTDTRVIALPEVFTEDLRYELKWVKAYNLEATVESVDDTTFFKFSVSPNDGAEQITDAHLILIAGYENDFFVKTFSSELDFTDGHDSAIIGVSSDRLSFVIAYLVEGTPTIQMYSDFAEYHYEVAGTGS